MKKKDTEVNEEPKQPEPVVTPLDAEFDIENRNVVSVARSSGPNTDITFEVAGGVGCTRITCTAEKHDDFVRRLRKKLKRA